jgi:hypothetical protein
MKKLLILSITALLMQSCISARINSHKLVENPGQYEKLLLMITDSENVFYQWDEENFNAVINGRFNDMDGLDRRRILGNNLQKHMPMIKILPADRQFDIHKLVSMDEFMNKISGLDFDGVLLLHTRGLWKEEVVIGGDSRLSPKSEFHVFLMDRNLFENQYMAKINVDGSPNNSFENLFDRLAKELATDLSNKGFIGSLDLN